MDHQTNQMKKNNTTRKQNYQQQSRKKAKRAKINASERVAHKTRKHKAWLMGNLLYSVFYRHFPQFPDLLQSLPDTRNQDKITFSRYDLVMAAIFLFVLKMGSRNQMNLSCNDEELVENVERLFGFKIAHMDTVNSFFEGLEPDCLEKVLAEMTRALIQKKVLRPNKTLNDCFAIAIDGSGDGSATEKDGGTLRKESKLGKVTYYRSLLLASIVTPNGFSIPVAVEWIATEDGSDKQDCELNALKRLADKLKRLFPRLRICLIGDALYANGSVLEICSQNNWHYIITVKENLSSVSSEAEGITSYFGYKANIDGRVVLRDVSFAKGLQYQRFKLNWIRTHESDEKERNIRFTYITDINFNTKNLPELISIARSRWNLEDTFNTIKNRQVHGLHKFAQKSFKAYKNWRIVMLIAQVIEQLVVMATDMSKIFDRANDTFVNLWRALIVYFSRDNPEPFDWHPRRKITYPK